MALATPDLLAQLPGAEFAGIKFPYTKCSVKSSLRHHVHEYPKAPGGAPEKLGRKLYTINFHGIFDAALLPPWNTNGNSLWPGALSELQDAFEDGVTSDLMIPSVGKIKAVLIDFTRDLEVKNRRSGETAELVFLEDQSQAYLVNGLVNVKAKDLSDKGQTMAIQVELAAPGLSAQEKTLLDSIISAIATVATIVATGVVIGELLTMKLDGLLQMFGLADGIPYMQTAEAFLLMAAFLDGWLATQALIEDLKRRVSVPILPYACYANMSVVDVAADLYGDTSRAVEVMQLNALEDPLRIPRGTMLRVYAPVDGETAAA